MSEEQETLLEFPCQFPLKVMGKSSEQFESIVVDIVQQHVEFIAEDAVSSKPSKGGKYTAVTVVIEATSKAQLDAIYMSLTSSHHVIMAL